MPSPQSKSVTPWFSANKLFSPLPSESIAWKDKSNWGRFQRAKWYKSKDLLKDCGRQCTRKGKDTGLFESSARETHALAYLHGKSSCRRYGDTESICLVMKTTAVFDTLSLSALMINYHLPWGQLTITRPLALTASCLQRTVSFGLWKTEKDRQWEAEKRILINKYSFSGSHARIFSLSCSCCAQNALLCDSHQMYLEEAAAAKIKPLWIYNNRHTK